MRVAVLGTTQFSIECAKKFIELGAEIKLFVSLPFEKLPLNSVNIKEFSNKYNIPYYESDDINSINTEDKFKECELDYIFSSWPYIINKNILDIPKYFVIGSHPTSLPFNRGRHPLHWLISQGIEKSDITLFKMAEGVDDGEILVQYTFECKYDIGIADVYKNMIEATLVAIELLYKKLEKEPNIIGNPQDHMIANYWRKKNIYDVMIDFRMTAIDIVRVVKSFNEPYNCAIFIYEKNIIRIENAEIHNSMLEIKEKKRIEPGKIIEIKEKEIYIKASDEIVKLKCLDNIATIKFKKYVFPPSKYIMEHYEFYANVLE